jgi:alanyl-tRNA synthetase
MTERIYYTDSMARSFEARVVSCERKDVAIQVRLDRTAFYPTSGGQPHDTGRLGSTTVSDVIDGDDGEIRHVVDAEIPVGTTVQGEVDWPRRLDHMQQHTGQHVLSAAFDRLFGVRTTSFHMGAEVSTIDLAREVTPAEIAQAESAANQVVWEDRPVHVRFASEEEAAGLKLRKEPTRTGRLRLVEVEGFDLSACGGTHVPTAGVIGIIAVTAWERFKGATRLTFVCGGRTLRSHDNLRDTVTAAIRVLSVVPSELAGAIERLQTEQKEADRTIKKLQDELAGFRAQALRQNAATIGPYRGVLIAQPGLDAAALRTLAAAIVSEPGMVAVLAGEGRPTPVVVARSNDVPIDAGAWMKRATAEFGGRGGGRPELSQGGIDAAPEQVFELARRTLVLTIL